MQRGITSVGVRRALAALVGIVALAASCSTSTPAGTATQADAARGTALAAVPGAQATAAGSSSTTTGTGPADRAAACTEPRSTDPEAREPRTMRSQDLERSFYLRLPDGADVSEPTPVIFNWHGSGSAANQQVLYSRFHTVAAAKGFAVITPDGTGRPRGWNMFRKPAETDDYRFFEDLYAEVASFVCIDPDRVYSTGISNGSAFTAFLACTKPYRFAAIAMVAATIPPICKDDAPKVSAMAFHGTADLVVPFGGGTVNATAANGVAAPGAESAMQNWATYDGCTGAPTKTQIGAAARTDYPECGDGTDVVLFALAGAGHTWPGPIDVAKLGLAALGATNNDVDASELMVDFFLAHRRAR